MDSSLNLDTIVSNDLLFNEFNDIEKSPEIICQRGILKNNLPKRPRPVTVLSKRRLIMLEVPL